MNTRGAGIAPFLVLLVVCTTPAMAQEMLSLDFVSRLRISERSNLSRTEDGRYVGLTSRQSTAYVTRSADGSYSGRTLIFEQTRRDMRQVGRGVDSSYETELTVSPNQAFTGTPGVPRYLGIPTLPTEPVRRGDEWTAPGFLLMELANRPDLALEIEVAYRYAGRDVFDGHPVHVLEGRFAARHPLPPDPDVESAPPVRSDIRRITGRHTLTILIPAGSGAPFFIRDELDEQIELPGEPVVVNRGHVLTFVYGLSSDAPIAVSESLQERLSTNEGIEVEVTDTGTRITINQIRFIADQAVILPEEQPRLDEIAASLSGLSGVRFLVVGHTADVGSVESQDALSWERARVITSELVRRGIPQTSIDVEGRGGREPVAANDSEENRAQNRRVEIYVLEE